jgi:hypothetical protein
VLLAGKFEKMLLKLCISRMRGNPGCAADHRWSAAGLGFSGTLSGMTSPGKRLASTVMGLPV